MTIALFIFAVGFTVFGLALGLLIQDIRSYPVTFKY